MIGQTTANQIRLNSGACINCDVTDVEIGVRSLIGYHNRFNMGVFDAVKIVQDRCEELGTNWFASYCSPDKPLPTGAIRVGQCIVRKGEEYPLYVVIRR